MAEQDEEVKRLDQDSSESEDSEDACQDMNYQGIKKESVDPQDDLRDFEITEDGQQTDQVPGR